MVQGGGGAAGREGVGPRRDYVCEFCLACHPGRPLGAPPDSCRCGVVRCLSCRTWLPGPSPAFCHGCGRVGPEAEPKFVGADQTACHHAVDAWKRRALGTPGGPVHEVWVDVGPGPDGRRRAHLVRRDGGLSSPGVTLRELTAGEAARMGLGLEGEGA